MGGLEDPDWYFDNVLRYAHPGGPTRVLPGPVASWRRWWDDREPEPCCAAAWASGFVLTTSELTCAGVTRSRVRHAVRTGRWSSAGRGMVGVVDVRGADSFGTARRRHALSAAGAARGRPGHVASGRSGAVLHGLPTLDVPRGPELTASQTRWRGTRNSARVFAATLPESDVGQWFGIPVTTVARTLVDLARHDRRDGIMAADAALREHLVSRRAVDDALDAAAGWPGIRRAREVLALADPLAESPLESLVRLAMHDDGFPAPELQVWFGRDRVDLYLGRHGLVVEADGRGKYVDDAFWAEKKREQRLRQHVRAVERVTWSDVLANWPATSARLRAAMRPPSSPTWS